jgi:RimJ/RimL family protein N-acetyltransferase
VTTLAAGVRAISAPPPIVLRSARLELRPIHPADRIDIARLHADPRVAALLVDAIPDTAAKAEIMLRWNAPLAEAGIGTFAVRRQGEARLIGLFSLTPFEGGEGLMELGGKLSPEAWAGGLAIEAGAAMIDYGFGPLGQDRLVSAFHPDQRSAAASLARLGFDDPRSGMLFDRAVTIMTLTRARWDAQGRKPRGLDRKILIDSMMADRPSRRHHAAEV